MASFLLWNETVGYSITGRNEGSNIIVTCSMSHIEPPCDSSPKYPIIAHAARSRARRCDGYTNTISRIRYGKEAGQTPRGARSPGSATGLQPSWEALTPLARNEWICWTISVKKPETRQEHVERVRTELKEGCAGHAVGTAVFTELISQLARRYSTSSTNDQNGHHEGWPSRILRAYRDFD